MPAHEYPPVGTVVYNHYGQFVELVRAHRYVVGGLKRVTVEMADHPRTARRYYDRPVDDDRKVGRVWSRTAHLHDRDEILAAPLTDLDRDAIRAYLGESAGTISDIARVIGRKPHELQVQLMAEAREDGWLDLANGVWKVRRDPVEASTPAEQAAQILAGALGRASDPDDPSDVVALAQAAAAALTGVWS